jgi:Cu+-exporting ATPase
MLMFVVVSGKPADLVGVADPIKPTTVEAIQDLHREGVKVVMLTVDNRTTAEAVRGIGWHRSNRSRRAS